MTVAIEQLTIEQQVAQRFIVGFSGLAPQGTFNRFLEAGLGGVIFFRENFDADGTPEAILQRNQHLQNQVPKSCPPLFLSTDQEGGRVERLPYTFFPSTPAPAALALADELNEPGILQQVYAKQSACLASLGFNLNYFPTLDVNLEPTNPIIGPRAFGSSKGVVQKFGKQAVETLRNNNIIPVAKHFPGHGNGTVDSHVALPQLTFTEDELKGFLQAIDLKIPAVLVSHGYYPALQRSAREVDVPASASPTVVKDLLRKKCGFQGVVISDDMCMGAITQHQDAITAAMKTIEAGVDVLVYKQSTETEWQVFEAIVAALQDEILDMEDHLAAVRRILDCKYQYLNQPSTPLYNKDSVKEMSRDWAQKSITLLSGELPSVLPLQPEASLWVIHPDRASIVGYNFDQDISPELPQLFEAAGFLNIRFWQYPQANTTSFNSLSAPEAIVFISHDPQRDPIQVELYEALCQQAPTASRILISAASPYCSGLLPNSTVHIALCSYRPPQMEALIDFLT
ncbi:MAG: hypothetical protein KTR14_09500 [Vampirovibrio sp.]|nr:hypothetical protein [Vampirovibrio sp.]